MTEVKIPVESSTDGFNFVLDAETMQAAAAAFAELPPQSLLGEFHKIRSSWGDSVEEGEEYARDLAKEVIEWSLLCYLDAAHRKATA